MNLQDRRHTGNDRNARVRAAHVHMLRNEATSARQAADSIAEDARRLRAGTADEDDVRTYLLSDMAGRYPAPDADDLCAGDLLAAAEAAERCVERAKRFAAGAEAALTVAVCAVHAVRRPARMPVRRAPARARARSQRRHSVSRFVSVSTGDSDGPPPPTHRRTLSPLGGVL